MDIEQKMKEFRKKFPKDRRVMKKPEKKDMDIPYWDQCGSSRGFNNCHDLLTAYYEDRIVEIDAGEAAKEIRKCAIGYVEPEQDIVKISITNISEMLAQHFGTRSIDESSPQIQRLIVLAIKWIPKSHHDWKELIDMGWEIETGGGE